MKVEIISAEQAEVEFSSLCENWDIDDNTLAMNEEDAQSFNSQKSKIIKSIKQGRCIPNGDEVTFKCNFGKSKDKEITLNIENALISAFDKHGKNDNTKKMCEYIASMAGTTAKEIFALDPRDLKPIQALTVLFLAS